MKTMTRQQAADFCNTTLRTIDRWAKHGRITAVDQPRIEDGTPGRPVETFYLVEELEKVKAMTWFEKVKAVQGGAS